MRKPVLYPLSYGAGITEDILPLRASPAGALTHDGEPVPRRAPLRVAWGCRFSAAPDFAKLVVASRQLRQTLA